jgi:hypothetical protein
MQRVNLFLFLLLVMSCSTFKPTTKLFLVVREKPGQLIQGIAQVAFHDGHEMKVRETNRFGFLVLTREDLKNGKTFDSLVVTATFNGKSASIYTNKFNSYYDVNLTAHQRVSEKDKIADMHYHLSLKTHNSFAVSYLPKKPPQNINWLHADAKKVLLYNTNAGSWRKYNLYEDYQDVQLLKRYLKRNWIRPADGANNLVHASEATFPHMLEGNVFLAFNAISPFEHSVSNQWVKRVVSSFMKSGAPFPWLNRLGGEDHITHWDNFNYEYNMITTQDSTFNNFHYHTLRRQEDTTVHALLEDKPLVVNVVEGAHIFQHTYFPHAVNFDLMDTLSKAKRELYYTIRDKACDLANAGQYHQQVCRTFRANEKARTSIKDSLTNSVLMRELISNISEFKKMNVHMISISHLSYNGMTGHAPALDVSKVPPGERFTSYLAKRAFGIRVSKDKQYIKSYDGLFFRVPGVNMFGDSAISTLLHIKDPSDRFVHIDLKHSDVITRDFIMDKYEEQSKKIPQKLRPICSHCAVNGLSINYYSPLLNEYSLLNSSLARKFYPFAINLFNEEIERICENEGIIGIPLEERVLGGYINNRQHWPKGISAQGQLKATGKRLNRIKYMKRAFRHLKKSNNTVYTEVEQYYVNLLKRDSMYYEGTDRGEIEKQEDDLRKLIFREYCSAEPFLQNVFHIVDIARKTKKQMKREELLNNAKRRAKEQRESRTIDTVITRNDRLREELSRATKEKQQDSLRARISQNTLSNLKDSTMQAAASFYQDVTANFRVILAKEINTQQLESYIRREAWRNVCIGSDFDGMIDPIDICGGASQYPLFKEKLVKLIPLFLFVRQTFEVEDKLLGEYQGEARYFDGDFKIEHAMHMLFYGNLKEFTENNFML